MSASGRPQQPDVCTCSGSASMSTASTVTVRPPGNVAGEPAGPCPVVGGVAAVGADAAAGVLADVGTGTLLPVADVARPPPGALQATRARPRPRTMSTQIEARL